jgi:hypothetical protein
VVVNTYWLNVTGIRASQHTFQQVDFVMLVRAASVSRGRQRSIAIAARRLAAKTRPPLFPPAGVKPLA